jgi:hypothetical protein
MEWILVALAAGAVWAFFNANVFWRRKKRSDIGHAVKSLLVLLEDGGRLSIRERSSPIKLIMVRETAPDSAVVLSLHIPREPWSSPAEENIRTLCESHGYEGTFATGAASHSLCEIRVPVRDIWNPSAGAQGARLVNLVLDALGVAQGARFKLDLIGIRSRRLLDREKALRMEQQA